MGPHVLAIVCDLRLPGCRSLKDKRAVVQAVCAGARRRYQVAAAETAEQDRSNRTELSFAVVAGRAGHAEQVADAVERFVWSFPEIEVIEMSRHWLETER